MHQSNTECTVGSGDALVRAARGEVILLASYKNGASHLEAQTASLSADEAEQLGHFLIRAAKQHRRESREGRRDLKAAQLERFIVSIQEVLQEMLARSEDDWDGARPLAPDEIPEPPEPKPGGMKLKLRGGKGRRG